MLLVMSCALEFGFSLSPNTKGSESLFGIQNIIYFARSQLNFGVHLKIAVTRQSYNLIDHITHSTVTRQQLKLLPVIISNIGVVLSEVFFHRGSTSL